MYEQDLLRDPGSVTPWLAYIEFKQQHGTLYEQAFVSRRSPRWLKLSTDNQYQVMERACKQLPRSYKLWKMVSSLAIDFLFADRSY